MYNPKTYEPELSNNLGKLTEKGLREHKKRLSDEIEAIDRILESKKEIESDLIQRISVALKKTGKRPRENNKAISKVQLVDTFVLLLQSAKAPLSLNDAADLCGMVHPSLEIPWIRAKISRSHRKLIREGKIARFKKDIGPYLFKAIKQENNG